MNQPGFKATSFLFGVVVAALVVLVPVAVEAVVPGYHLAGPGYPMGGACFPGSVVCCLFEADHPGPGEACYHDLAVAAAAGSFVFAGAVFSSLLFPGFAN